MRHLNKLRLSIKEILEDCATSYRSETRNGIKAKIFESIDEICNASENYDNLAGQHNWSAFHPHTMVNGILSKEDMCDIYDSKFVKNMKIRTKYYDRIMSLATTGKCPICNIGQVSTLDHYLAKTIYPMYAVTPYNLVPVCKDCNFAKLDSPVDSKTAPLHPYYDEIDSVVWLKATLIKSGEGIAVEFKVCEDITDQNLYRRLQKHIELYGLNKAYSIQATAEIAENIRFWGEKLKEWGHKQFKEYLEDVLYSKEMFQRNTWNTALLRALIENVEILE